MTTPILPDSEIVRIKKMAKDWYNRDEWSSLHTNVSAFIEGASFEYSASLQREKDKCIAFAEFLFKKYRVNSYSGEWMWERLPRLLTPITQLFNTDQVYSLFFESLNK